VSRSAHGIVCEPTVPALADAIESAITDPPHANPGLLTDAPAAFADEWVREHDWSTVAATIALALAPAPAPSGGGSPPTESTIRFSDPREARGPGFAFADLALSLAGIIAIAALSRVRHAWVLQATELLLLLSLPGLLLLRAAGVGAAAVRAFPLYIPAASLVVLMASGLGVDLIGPLLDVSRPLATWPLTAGICAISLVLTAIAL